MQYSTVRIRVSKFLFTAVSVAAIFGVTFTSQTAHAQTYNLLYNFPGGSGGFGPFDTIVAPNGTIYGIAEYGKCACSFIFSLSNGKLTVLHRFSEPAGNEPDEPQGLLLNKNATVLYGTTMFGGLYNGNCIGTGVGCGRVFSYDITQKKYAVLHEFSGEPDGMDPSGTQVLASNGDLYGITWGGGANGWGSFYKVTPERNDQVLYSFQNSPDGQGPGDGLSYYNDNFYGVTIGGGNTACPDGCGTIFRANFSGQEHLLYSFTGGTDGQNPYELIGDGRGNFYGISRNSSNVVVAVFEINASGHFTIAYDGSLVSEIKWVIPGPSGNLYAVANGGYSSCQPDGCGQILQLTPTGGGNADVKVLHQFNGTDGADPQIQGLILHSGVLYGATASGGSANQGTIFKLIP